MYRSKKIKKKSLKQKFSTFEAKQKIAGYVFCIPLIFGLLALFIPNIIRTGIFSISDIVLSSDGFDLLPVGISHYKEALFSNEKFNGLAIQSLGNMLLDLPIILIFSLFVASMLNKKFIGRTFVRSVFFFTIILSTGIVTTIQSSSNWNLMSTGVSTDLLAQGGASASKILESLNVGEGLMKIITSAAGRVSSIVTASGMQILLFLTAFQEISPEYYEAARVDGCSQWEMYWKITIPLMAPQIVVNAVYTIADSFVRSESKLFSYINGLAFSGNQYSLAMAMYFLYLLAMLVVIGVLAMVYARFVKSGK